MFILRSHSDACADVPNQMLPTAGLSPITNVFHFFISATIKMQHSHGTGSFKYLKTPCKFNLGTGQP